MFLLEKIARRWRWLKLVLLGAKVDYGIQSFDNFIKGNISNFKCGNLYISQGSKIIIGSHQGKNGKLNIGSGVYINHYSIIDCHNFISIGNNVAIGPHCYLGDFDHDINVYENFSIGGKGITKPIIIQDNVWLGANVTILKGVTIGEGAVIGAGSVVTKDVAPLSIVAGNPARLIKMRNVVTNSKSTFAKLTLNETLC